MSGHLVLSMHDGAYDCESSLHLSVLLASNCVSLLVFLVSRAVYPQLRSHHSISFLKKSFLNTGQYYLCINSKLFRLPF